jgi:hypothetical protein
MVFVVLVRFIIILFVFWYPLVDAICFPQQNLPAMQPGTVGFALAAFSIFVRPLAFFGGQHQWIVESLVLY